MRTKLRRRAACALTGVMIGGALVACGDPSRQASGGEGQYPTRLVLADRKAGDGFHPATGYAQTGVSPIYDGLLRPEPSSSDKVPNFVPALAAEMPKHNADSTKWTVKLKEGVKFSDGSDFDAEDVKASYDVAKDISAGSEVVSRYDIIDEVQVQDPHTVVFKLRSPTCRNVVATHLRDRSLRDAGQRGRYPKQAEYRTRGYWRLPPEGASG